MKSIVKVYVLLMLTALLVACEDKADSGWIDGDYESSDNQVESESESIPTDGDNSEESTETEEETSTDDGDVEESTGEAEQEISDGDEEISDSDGDTEMEAEAVEIDVESSESEAGEEEAELSRCATVQCAENRFCNEEDGKCYCLPGFHDAVDHCVRVEAGGFEDLDVGDNTYLNGSDLAGGFTSGIVHLVNNYNSTYNSWDGFAISSMIDKTTPGSVNSYSAIAGAGSHTTKTYAIGYASAFAATPPTITFSDSQARKFAGAWITNTTYTYLSMRDGDSFAKKFGGESGSDPDWFMLSITGKDMDGQVTGNVEFYLADFRFAPSRSGDDARDYLVDQWTWVDLRSLGNVSKLEFALSSSDVGEWGMNTPSYFALDELTLDAGVAHFEDMALLPDSFNNGSNGAGEFVSGNARLFNTYDSTYQYWEGFAISNKTDTATAGYTNPYSAISGTGMSFTPTYAVAYVGFSGPSKIEMNGDARTLAGLWITNTTYAYLSMRDGDSIAKKFGGESGSDQDWFMLTITGKNAANETTSQLEFYLADFRPENAEEDYIISDWTWVPLESLGFVKALEFTLSSSDNGEFGMNTPAYFALDDLFEVQP